MQPPARPASSSYTSQDPPPRTELWWDRVPSLKIVRPPKGIYSPKVDERCFTYCSQSITGRINGTDPWCRTICFRRVFLHEVTRVLSTHRTQTVKNVPGEKSILEVTEHVETGPVNHPLPPEGQRYTGWLSMLIGDRFADEEDIHDGSPMHTHGQHEQKHWQEGWYLWWSTSRWAAQEKLDLMRRDLGGQVEWQRLKDKRNEEWEKGLPSAEEAHGEAQEPHPFEDLGNSPPFPDVSSSSLLLPLPIPPTSLRDLAASLQPALAPTGRVLTLVQESISSGAQKEFWGRVWEKAQTDEPRKLLVVAWGRVKENFLGKEEEGSGGGGANGNGKDEKR